MAVGDKLKSQCQLCWNQSATKETRDLYFVYFGIEIQLKNITATFCDNCNDAIFSEEEANYYQDKLKKLKFLIKKQLSLMVEKHEQN